MGRLKYEATSGKQLPTFPHRVHGLNPRPQRWEVSVLTLHHRGPSATHRMGCIGGGEGVNVKQCCFCPGLRRWDS